MSTSRALEKDRLAAIAADESRLISRRAVVRTGVTAAWSVPLIQVVGAAPALAVSGTKVEVQGGTAIRDGNEIRVTVPVRNSGAQAVATLTVILTFSANMNVEPKNAPRGWSTSTSNGGGRVTITYTGAVNLTAGAGASYAFDIRDRGSKTATGSVDVVVTSGTVSAGTTYTIKPESKS